MIPKKFSPLATMAKKSVFITALSFILIELFLKIYACQPNDPLKLGWLKVLIGLNDFVVKNYLHITRKMEFLKRDDFLGYVLNPGTTVKAVSREYSVQYKIEDAFSDGQIGINDEPIREDIFALAFGDSYTFCWGVEREKCWVEITEGKIGREIVNFGVFGYGFIQKFRLFNIAIERIQKLPLFPKLVFFQVMAQDLYDDLCFIGKTEFCYVVHPLLFFQKKGNISSVFLIIDFIMNKKWILPKIPESEKKQLVSDYKKLIKIIEDTCSKNGLKILWISDQDFPVKLPDAVILPSEKKYYFTTELHLNEQGNMYIAEKILPKLEVYLKAWKRESSAYKPENTK